MGYAVYPIILTLQCQNPSRWCSPWRRAGHREHSSPLREWISYELWTNLERGKGGLGGRGVWEEGGFGRMSYNSHSVHVTNTHTYILYT